MSEDDSGPAQSDPGPDDAPAEPSPPDRYVREGLLGKGGMGRVYVARDQRLHRQVALKEAASPALAARLGREAAITAQLEHPGIVAVYDAGEHDGRAWYAMRLVRGRTLGEELRGCADLPARLALLPHLLAACQAIAYAHAMGIVHRDLKPANIIVGEFGETQVADWGLARPVDEAREDWSRIGAPATSSSAGTPRYMSPEQARGEPATFRSDVYALGGVLSELLDGRPPPDGAGVGPDLAALSADVPVELVAVARRCLAASPSERYPSAIELAKELERWLAGRRVQAHEYRLAELLGRAVRRWRAPLAVAGFAALVLALGGFEAARRTAKERTFAEANLGRALVQQALTAFSQDRLPEAEVLAAHALRYAESPEARGVIAGAAAARATRVETLALPEVCRNVGTLSPDGRRIACPTEGRVEVWRLAPLAREATIDQQVIEPLSWHGDELLLGTPDALLAARGAQVRSLRPGWLWPIGDDTLIFAVNGRNVHVFDGDVPVASFQTCTGARATTTTLEGRLYVGCADGQLRVYDPHGEERSLPLEERDPGWSTVVAQDGRLLVGRLDGDVHALDLATGARGPTLGGVGGSVLELRPIPGSALVLVRGERGGLRLWDTRTDTWAGSLPGGAARTFPGTASGEVRLLGDTLVTWRLENEIAPSVLEFGRGLSQIAVAADGRSVAVALGSGEVVQRSVKDGATIGRWQLGEGVAKCVAFARDGTLLASGMSVGARRLLPDGASRPYVDATLRRMGVLASGLEWGLGYAGAIHVGPEGERVPEASMFFDGSVAPDGAAAALVDETGGVWRLDAAGVSRVTTVSDAVAVDLAETGEPVVARRREVCFTGRCVGVPGEIVDISTAGGRVALGMLDGDVRILDRESLTTVAVLRRHTARVSSVELDPAGTWLWSGSWDGTARHWNLTDLGTPAAELVARGEERWGIDLDAALAGR